MGGFSLIGALLLFILLLVRLTVPSHNTIKNDRWFRGDYDDTDDVKNRERSGLLLFIDHGTGCHYIKHLPTDTLTPRLDKHGKIVREYQQEVTKHD